MGYLEIMFDKYTLKLELERIKSECDLYAALDAEIEDVKHEEEASETSIHWILIP